LARLHEPDKKYAAITALMQFLQALKLYIRRYRQCLVANRTEILQHLASR
jgi:hypothetical protein